MNNSILGSFKIILYQFNPETGYYQKTDQQPEPFPVMRMPFELRRQQTQEEKIKVNAEQIIASKTKLKNGSFKFLTGLQPAAFNGWFVGNDFEKINGRKVTSAILFYFTDNNSRLVVYYFPRYDRDSAALRLRWANFLIPELRKRGR